MGEYVPDLNGRVVVLYPHLIPNRGVGVERINPFAFFEFGKELHLLSQLKDTSPQKVFWPLWQARNAMGKLIDGNPIPIGISLIKARALAERIDNLLADRFQRKDEKGEVTLRFPEESDPPITAWSLEWIKTAITEFEAIFAEEMRETATYFVPRRGIYHTPALVDDADQTFPKELQPFIPQKTKEDWKSAGRCLAFNMLSASRCHGERAVEACLEAYYGKFSGKPGETLHGWYDYIKALREVAEGNPTPCPSEKTLAELDQMREDYRNPIVHPRLVL
jgi:hypothetical protein